MSAIEESPRKPRLLVLASTYPRWADDPEPGFVHELSKRLVDRFEVTVVCPHAPGALSRETLDEVEVIRYRYAPAALETLVNDGGIVTNLKRTKWKLLLVPTFVLAQAWQAWRLLRTRTIDVVHAHWLVPQGLIAALLTLLHGSGKPPFVVTSHGADLFALRAPPLQALKRFVLRRAAVSTVVSEGMWEEIARLGADASGVQVEPMGVDLVGRFHPDPATPREKHELLFVGRLVEKKGLRHLIDGMPVLLALRPDITLTIAGFGPELEERRAQVNMLGLTGCVTFLGAVAQTELPALYRRASLFVAPFVEAANGDQEGLGLVLVEALACGCQVVTSDLPATRGLAEKCPALHIVPPGDSAALVAKVLQVLEQELPMPAEHIATYDWEVRADAYGAIFGRVLSERCV